MLDQHMGQELAQKSSVIIGHGILITNELGEVIGCSNSERIGTIHEASLPVISQREPIFLDEQAARMYKGTVFGVTFPIEVGQQVVGSVGITGRLDEVSRFGQLIKLFADMFVKEKLERNLTQLRDNEHHNLLVEIIACRLGSDDEAHTTSHAESLGYQIDLPRAAILIELNKADSDAFVLQTAKNILQGKETIFIPIDQHKIAVFAPLNSQNSEQHIHDLIKNQLPELCRHIHNRGTMIRIGIGSMAAGIGDLRKSYFEACQAAGLCRWDSHLQHIIYIRDLYAERLIFGISKEVHDNVAEQIFAPILQSKNRREIIKLILAWCDCKFNAAETARMLHIHINTLSYRIDQIKKLTSMNLRDFKDAMTLYILATHYTSQQSD